MDLICNLEFCLEAIWVLSIAVLVSMTVWASWPQADSQVYLVELDQSPRAWGEL